MVFIFTRLPSMATPRQFIRITTCSITAKRITCRRFAYPYAEVVVLNTTLVNIAPQGWGDADKGGDVRFWEYNSHHPDGSLVDVSQRVPWSRQLDRLKDAKRIKDYGRPEFVLAGWKPKLEVRVK